MSRMSRVLVIDDEESVVRAVKRRLERQGYTVEMATSAAEGVELIYKVETPFDVVVTDMSMDLPESGLQVLHAATTRDMFTEVIVMTAYGNVANAVECMRRGAFDYIEKNAPDVDAYEAIAAKVDQALARRRHDIKKVDLWESLKQS